MKKVVASLGEDSGYIPYTAYCAKKSYLEDNEDIMLKFTKAIQKGLDYVNTHDSKANVALEALIVRYYEEYAPLDSSDDTCNGQILPTINKNQAPY